MGQFVVRLKAERPESLQPGLLMPKVVLQGLKEGVVDKRCILFTPSSSPSNSLRVLPLPVLGEEVYTDAIFVLRVVAHFVTSGMIPRSALHRQQNRCQWQSFM